jgi:ammonia channel protein AmtB
VQLTAAVLFLLVLPAVSQAAADTANVATSNAAIDTLWVLICAFMVIFMLTGFAALEVGLVRGKNAGSIIAKVIMNAGIATIAFCAVGFALGFGGGNDFAGSNGFFLSGFSDQFTAIKATIGMRVSATEEDDGLDISDHGMYGYPEVFIPSTELADPGMPGATSYQTHQALGTMP